ncbi:hypothetical protein HAX54_043657, partial [Datura stramonium]|nr:hypothetical protein [Datura stramonium]
RDKARAVALLLRDGACAAALDAKQLGATWQGGFQRPKMVQCHARTTSNARRQAIGATGRARQQQTDATGCATRRKGGTRPCVRRLFPSVIRHAQQPFSYAMGHAQQHWTR